MRAERKRNHRSAKTDRQKIEQARAEALRESFRLGGAMQDLKRAADSVQIAMIELDRAVWKTGPRV